MQELDDVGMIRSGQRTEFTHRVVSYAISAVHVTLLCHEAPIRLPVHDTDDSISALVDVFDIRVVARRPRR